MTKRFKPLNRDEFGILIAFAALLFGGWVRIYTVISAQFPINDGGMFYRMTEVIIQNGFKLPAYFRYNGFDIAFAYPPLAFYLAAGLNLLFYIELTKIFLYLPAIILIATIPAFYELAKTLLGDKLQAGIATLLFSLMPRSITWFIMGGGITRSMGLLFLILAVKFLYLAHTQPRWRYSVLSFIFCGLVVLSHPEASLHTFAIALLIWLYLNRTRKGFNITFLVGLGTILMTSVWWLPVLLRVGVDPLLSAGKTGLNSNLGMLYPFVHFDLESYITFIMVFGFLGIFSEIAARRYFLPIFYFLPFIVELRSSANVAIIPLAMLGAIAICNLILGGLIRINKSNNSSERSPSFQTSVLIGGMAFLTIYLVGSIQYHASQLAKQNVTVANRTAMRWIRSNTPKDSKFIVLTGSNDPLRDWVSEWFPALTDRASLMTVQGQEWVKGTNFVNTIEDYQTIQSCLFSINPLACIVNESTSRNLSFEYLYITKMMIENSNPTSTGATYLIFQLMQSDDFINVYNTDAAVIFQHNNAK